MIERTYLEVVPNRQPTKDRITGVGRALTTVLDSVGRIEFVVTRTAPELSFRFGVDTANPTSILTDLATELADVLPREYEFGIVTDKFPDLGTPGFVRWSAPQRTPHFGELSVRPLTNLLEALIFTNRPFYYQVIIEQHRNHGVKATPRVGVVGEPIQAIVDAFTPSGFEGTRYGPAHSHSDPETIRHRFMTFDRSAPEFFEGDRTITLPAAKIGHLVDFPLAGKFVGGYSRMTLPESARPIPDLRPSRDAEFLHIDPAAIRAPKSLEELAEDLYRGGDTLGDIEALYMNAAPNDDGQTGIFLRSQTGSLEALCERLGAVCPEDTSTQTFTLDANTVSGYEIDRYYVPESVDVRQRNVPRSLANRLMRQFAESNRNGVVHIVAEPYTKGDAAFVTAIRVLRPAGSEPLESDPLKELGFSITHPDGPSAVIEGTADFPGTTADGDNERIFLDPSAFAGLLLISPFWDSEGYLPGDAPDLDIDTLPTIRSSVASLQYDEPIVIDNRHLPDNIQYSPDDQEYVCTDCNSRYPAPLQTEGPQPLEDAFTCCSGTLADVDMDAVRQPALAGVGESLAEEWGLSRPIIEFLILVSKAHATHLDSTWEYNYRDSMTDLRDFLGLDKAHVDDLRGENGSGTALIRVHRSRKKYYELTAFGRTLTSHIRTREETDTLEYGDPAESIVHVTGQTTTEQFARLLPGVESTNTEVQVSTLIDTERLPESIRSEYATARIDVVAFDAEDRPQYLMEFEVDGDHPADTIRDARKMGIVGTLRDIPVGFVTPNQRVGKAIADILQQYGEQQRGHADTKPHYLGDPTVLADTLDHPTNAAIVEVATSIITADTPLSFIMPLGHVIDNVLEADDMRRSLESDEFHSLAAFLGVLYSNQYKDADLGDFLS